MTVTDAALVGRRRFWDALQRGDADAGREVVGQQLDDGVAGRTVIEQLFVPAQRAVGLEWQRAAWSVADEHAATAVVDAALAVVEHNAARLESTGPSVVVTCAESEWHALPARLAAQLLRESGVRAVFLGPSVPADHLREYLARLAPDALVLSATMPTSLAGAGRCIAAAHDVGLPVVAGGAAFGLDGRRAQILGADGWFADVAHFDLPVLRSGIDASRQPAWLEWQTLQAVRDASCATALTTVLASLPAFALVATPTELQRMHEDLRHIVDFAGAAVLVGDDALFHAFTAWLREVLTGRGLPMSALDVEYAALAAELGGSARRLLTTSG
jgi:methanogenic corrinoid protein MtbC1